MKKLFYIFISMVLSFNYVYASPQETSVKLKLRNYNRDFARFSFLESPDLDIEYPYSKNQDIDIVVELSGITTMVVNGSIAVCLLPGDSFTIDIEYLENNDRKATFSGSDNAVTTGILLEKIRENRKRNRYKTNMITAMVIQNKVSEYYESCKLELREEIEILNNYKNKISPNVYSYLKADIEGVILSNLISFPHIYAEFMKKDLQTLLPKDYWKVLDKYNIHTDQYSLRNIKYLSFLMKYREYERNKEKELFGKEYITPVDIKGVYHDLAIFYKSEVRDAVLFSYIYEIFASGNNFEEAEKLFNDYVKNYNINKKYKTTIEQVMQ